ncbi:MAG TPA: methyltransferase domain-containing protein [Acidimicrobiales bacterium]|nr:methyltransferase domain-containing protein [Acidimicrobiales bacterium]
MLRRLPTLIEPEPGRPEPDPDHPMRKVTRQVAFDPAGWTPERAAKVVELFDGLAPEWHTRGTDERMTGIDDALERGGPFPPGPCLEAGCGVGLLTPRLVARFEDVIASDISYEMLGRAPHITPLVLADSSRLPFPDRSIGTLVLVNMFLFPVEVERVIADDGVVLWINSLGPATPIHLPAEEVQAALGDAWDGVHAEAGWGTWASMRRRPR